MFLTHIPRKGGKKGDGGWGLGWTKLLPLVHLDTSVWTEALLKPIRFCLVCDRIFLVQTTHR